MNQLKNNNVQVEKTLNLLGVILAFINLFFYFIIIYSFISFLIFQSNNVNNNNVLGWLLLITPLLFVTLTMLLIPDICNLIFCFSYKKKKKRKSAILIIIFSLLGCILITSPLITDLFKNINILRYIYIVLKIIMIILYLYLLFINENSKYK